METIEISLLSYPGARKHCISMRYGTKGPKQKQLEFDSGACLQSSSRRGQWSCAVLNKKKKKATKHPHTLTQTNLSEWPARHTVCPNPPTGTSPAHEVIACRDPGL